MCEHDVLVGGDEKLNSSVLLEQVIAHLHTQLVFLRLSLASDVIAKLGDLLDMVGA